MDNEGIWRAALIKAAPVMLFTVVVCGVTLVPLYLMTPLLIQQSTEASLE